MAILYPILLVLSIAAGVVREIEAPPRPLHFRLEIGIEKIETIAGYLDQAPGTTSGYNRFVLDLDGDGVPETVRKFPMKFDPDEKHLVLNPVLTLEREGAAFELELYGFDGRAAPRVYMNWTVRRDDAYLWFINGRAAFHGTRERAAEGTPIRLAPPFRFEVDTTTRGAQNFLKVGVVDANGCSLRLANAGRERHRMRIRLSQDEQTVLDTPADYG